MTKRAQRFGVDNLVRVQDWAEPKSWAGRTVRILSVDPATSGCSALYDVVDVNTGEEDMNFFDEDLEPSTQGEARTINIDVKLDFDVETMVSNLRSSIAQSLRALADEIEEPQ